MKIARARPDTSNMGRPFEHARSVRAFSLVELVIVVAVLGILGAMVAGRFGQTADQARDAAQKVDVNTVKAAIARYQADHGGASPAFNTLASQLTNPTNYAGRIGAAKTDEYRFGPYLPKMPDVTIHRASGSGGSDLVVATADGAPIWYYSESSGRLYSGAEYADLYSSASFGRVFLRAD